MSGRVLNFLGISMTRREAQTRQPPTVTTPRLPFPRVEPEELNGLRMDTRDLTTAVEFLAGQLQDTVTRSDVDKEIDTRLARLEQTHAGALSGAKNQMRRTRRAAWVAWAFMLAFTSFATIQVHDLHINECMLTLPSSAAKDFGCQAIFPLSDHGKSSVLAGGIEYLRTGEVPEIVHRDFAIPPRTVGLVFYAALFGGVAYGVVRYRRRSEDEDLLEVGDVTQRDLDTLYAARNDGLVPPGAHGKKPQSREDAP